VAWCGVVLFVDYRLAIVGIVQCLPQHPACNNFVEALFKVNITFVFPLKKHACLAKEFRGSNFQLSVCHAKIICSSSIIITITSLLAFKTI
jgi:hypothetical protein